MARGIAMINNKKVLSVTLARGGSKRVPKKNIYPICGKFLLQYTTDEVKKSKYIDRYVVSTDDDDIKKVCEQLDVECLGRSEPAARDTATTAEALFDVLNKVEFNEFYYLVEIMCTNPLKTIDDIDSCIEKIDETGADSVVSVVRVWDYHPSRVKYIENGQLKDFYPEVKEMRRQDLTPPAYIRNGSIYATTMESFVKVGARLGDDTRPYIMPGERTINIDEMIDLYIAEQIIEERNRI